MKSKTSFFKVSPALIKEDFRKFWAIPVLAFIVYFLSGIFYLIMNYSALSSGSAVYMANFVNMMLTGSYFVFSINLVWVPVMSALLVFRYLHSSGTVMSVHSQPFSRGTLLNSHTISCILFAVIPIIVTGIILMLMSQPVYYDASYYVSQDDMVNLFARSRILRWMIESIITTLFVLMISIIGGLITGTSLHHAIAAVGFNGVVSLISLVVVGYYEVYMFGYTVDGGLMSMIAKLSPVSAAYLGDFMSPLLCLAYVAAIVIFYVFAMFLYSRRKLEKATDGIVFRAFDIIITLIFGFLGMSGLGMLFYALFPGSGGAAFFGYFGGAILGILICRMIIMKTFRVFNKGTLKLMAVFLVIPVLLFIFVGLDVTNYEGRITEDAKEISIDIGMETSGIDAMNYNNINFSSSEGKEAIINLHKFIIENKDICKAVESENNSTVEYESDYNSYEENTTISISYYADEDSVDAEESRFYRVPAYLIVQSEEFRALFDTQEYKDKCIERIPSLDTLVNALVYPTRSSSTTVSEFTVSDPAQLEGLRKAIVADMNALNGDKVAEYYNCGTVASIELFYNITEDHIEMEADTRGSSYVSNRTINIKEYDTNTLNWLALNGYGDYKAVDGSAWNFAVVSELDENGPVNYHSYNGESYSTDFIPESSEGVTVVSDPQWIAALYTAGRSHTIYGPLKNLTTEEDDLYYVQFYCNDREYDGDGDAYIYMEYSAYVKGSDLPY